MDTDDGAGPASVGTVTRLVERVDSGDLQSAKAGIWSGYAYPTPEPLGLPYKDVRIPVENGMAPAWQFPPSEACPGYSGTWAIHVHGLGGKKSGALRGVPVAGRRGYTSLVVSFRNDGEAPASADRRYHLGQSEWRDVDAAVSYAVDQGANQIVLFGWSLGGTIALQLTLESEFRDRIAGLVLDAPVIDWTLIHSERDRSTPFAVSRRFVDRRPDLATLVTFPSVEHTQEWNVDPEGWDAAVSRWLRNRVESG